MLHQKKGSLPGDNSLRRLICLVLNQHLWVARQSPASLAKWSTLPPAQAISLLDSNLPEGLSPLRLRQMSWQEPGKLDPQELNLVAEALVKAMGGAGS